MAKINTRAYLLLIARLVVSGIFLLAALPKIQDPVAFAASVEGFRVVGGALTAWVALILPWLELVIGFGLLIPQIRRRSGILIAILLIAFIGLHISAWMRGLDISCGCFGENEASTAPNYPWLIFRNVGLLAACICVVIRDWRNPRARAMTELDITS
ncbi:MAG: putative oxidoreductase [Candidatus Azotimanducaceae bacterium]|jgi:putative oxidoreductase